MCGEVGNIHTLLTGLEVECCGYFSQDEGSEYNMITRAHAAVTSLSPRPKTKPSTDHFQYRMCYTGSDIHAG